MSDGEFSVWVFLAHDHHFPVEQFVDAATAMRVAKRATIVPGNAQRIIITDGGDHTCFEWQRGKGMTFPSPVENRSNQQNPKSPSEPMAGWRCRQCGFWNDTSRGDHCYVCGTFR